MMYVIQQGKLKFCGEWTSDITYTKSFMCWQPLPTHAARIIHRAPYWFHAISLTVISITNQQRMYMVMMMMIAIVIDDDGG